MSAARKTHLTRTPTTLPLVLTWCGKTAERAGDDYLASDPDRVDCDQCLRFMRRDLEFLTRWANA